MPIKQCIHGYGRLCSISKATPSAPAKVEPCHLDLRAITVTSPVPASTRLGSIVTGTHDVWSSNANLDSRVEGGLANPGPEPEADAPAGRDEATSAGSLPKRLHLHNTNLVHANERLMAAGTRQQSRSCGDQ